MRTGRLVIVEEQPHDAGWGASLVSRLTLAGIPVEGAIRVLSLPDHLLIPYAPALEDAIVPSADAVAEAIRSWRVR
jgi:pyruvate dehydrogenase E1 component beta subunit